MLVVVRLSGGLGNQLFQYAAGRALSIKHGVPILLDKSFYSDSPNRNYKLSSFNVSDSQINKKDLFKIFHKRNLRITEFFKPVKSILAESELVYKEKNFAFNSDFTSLNAPVILDGYWQSEKYFLDYASIIKNDFKIVDQFDVNHSSVASKILNEQSVAIHIRRGDYVSNPHINAIHGVCDEDYYVRAYELLVQKVGKVVPYFFSDDNDAAQRIIKRIGNGVLISDIVPGNDISDFSLMRSCQYFIIANSTFSWWAAYLGSNENKIVLAPKNWFKSEEYSTDDLIPLNWMKV
jgi:Glycosyl transferase family 11